MTDFVCKKGLFNNPRLRLLGTSKISSYTKFSSGWLDWGPQPNKYKGGSRRHERLKLEEKVVVMKEGTTPAEGHGL